MFEIETVNDEYVEWSFNLLSNDGFTDFDPHGDDIYKAAIQAIIHARVDGQSSGKHSPESWQEETIENQVEHLSIHADNVYTDLLNIYHTQEKHDAKFNLQEAEHALCRLAIAIALYKKEKE